MESVSTYQKRLRALLSPEERQLFVSLKTPHKIQDYLDTLEINFEESGETTMSPRRVIRIGKAHCIEGALLAATSLAYHGSPPLLLDFQTLSIDEDHVIAVFKQDGLWGAISKTNHAILRWRDPLYRSVRELAMSYYHEYYMDDGRKTLATFSRPFDLRRYAPKRWVTAEEDLEWLCVDLDESTHTPIAPRALLRGTRPASPIERELLNHREWQKPESKR